MSVNPPQAATVNCPACRAQYTVPVQSIVDVGRDPRLKSLLLQGRLNVGVCPQCGTGGMLSSPLIYHDPDKELLLCLIPQELNLPENERQRMIGQLSNRIINSLPAERRRGYLLQPRPFLTFQGLLEAVLEADGITRDMLNQQRAKAQAISEMAEIVQDPLGLAARLGEYGDIIDEEFFAVLDAGLRQAEQSADETTTGKLRQLRQALLERTPAGRVVAEREQALEKALAGLDESSTRDDLLDRIAAIDSEHLAQVLGVLIAVVRPLVDYQFFQLLTGRIESAEHNGDVDTAKRLKTVRKDILDLTQRLDAEVRERMQEAGQLLSEILQADGRQPPDDTRSVIRTHMPDIDSTFFSVLEANIAANEQQQRHDVAERLRAIRNLISEVMLESAPPAIRLINRLLQADYPDETRKMLRENQAMINADLFGLLDMLAQDSADRGEDQTSERLAQIKAQAELLS